MRDKVIVVRHPAMATLYVEQGLCPSDTPILQFANIEDVRGKDLFGVVPLHLAAHANSVTEIPIVAGRNTRNIIHDVNQLRQYARPPVRYRVTSESIERSHSPGNC